MDGGRKNRAGVGVGLRLSMKKGPGAPRRPRTRGRKRECEGTWGPPDEEANPAARGARRAEMERRGAAFWTPMRASRDAASGDRVGSRPAAGPVRRTSEVPSKHAALTPDSRISWRKRKAHRTLSRLATCNFDRLRDREPAAARWGAGARRLALRSRGADTRNATRGAEPSKFPAEPRWGQRDRRLPVAR